MPQVQTEDPRAFQIAQIQRRFKPTVIELEEKTELRFGLVPSDPDFPYEIDALQCTLLVPKQYPSSDEPTLRVTNNDIPRGFQINIERGFDQIYTASPNATLLGLFNRLDKQLDQILSGQMAETVKLVINRGPPPAEPKQTVTAPAPVTKVIPERLAPPRPRYTEGQRAVALAKRRTAARQLEARFSRVQGFKKSSDGTSYTLPLDSPKRPKWPGSLQSLRTFTLVLPELYPLNTCFIHLDSDGEEARAVEQAFLTHASEIKDATLTQLVNHLTIHIADMAVAGKASDNPKPRHVPEPAEAAAKSDSVEPQVAEPNALPPHDSDRQHIVHIPRPPEWTPKEDESGEDTGSDSDYSYDSGDETEGNTTGEEARDSSAPTAPAERGILLSFPHLELHGIELLELTSLSLTVKCQRCKDITDVEKLRNNAKGDVAGSRQMNCKKCAQALIVGFRMDLMHESSARGGYLDLDNCTVIDMLPRYYICAKRALNRRITLTRHSNFVPTCSECSTAYPAPGLVSVRGESAMANCRECHHRMSTLVLAAVNRHFAHAS